ncbi:MAG: hypothetical protein A49_29320 [Methyloceanibacter sp.]|nr:MAG: hypothetical protein A49_29320 [Methyloceanibacter sp.]
MDGVAAKIAEKILVLFEDGDLHARAREQKAEHDAGWTAAGNRALDSDRPLPLRVSHWRGGSYCPSRQSRRCAIPKTNTGRTAFPVRKPT